jgi:hypothetical protein
MALDFTITEYAAYNLLHEFDPEKKGFLSKARFYKAIYVLNQRLKKRKIDIRLPWRWYIFGPVVELEQIDQSVFMASTEQSAEREEDEPKTHIFYNERPDVTGLETATKTAIDYEIRRLAKENPSTRELINIVYGGAPIPFIPLLKNYDDWIHSDGVGKDAFGQFDRMRLQLIAKYPRDFFPQSYGVFLRLLDFTERDLSSSKPDIGELADLARQSRSMMGQGFSTKFYEYVAEDVTRQCETRFFSDIQGLSHQIYEKEAKRLETPLRNRVPMYEELEQLLDASYRSA